jgi:hypothetical protein
MTSESKTEANLAVLTATMLCECGCVNLTVSRDGIDVLSHGGTVSYTCKHCDKETLARAASEQRAKELLPDLLPGPKTEVWVHPYPMKGTLDKAEH